MFKQIQLRNLLTATVMLFSVSVFAQSNEGDDLITYLGKSYDSKEVQSVIKEYKCERGNESHCVSPEGIELILHEGLLSEIHLYEHSSAFGTYKGKLPKGIRFGMSPGEVSAKLGKPTLQYSNGYSEFTVGNYYFSCWFEGSKLTQVNISARSGKG